MEETVLNEQNWNRWAIHSAKYLTDLSEVLKPIEIARFKPGQIHALELVLSLKRWSERLVSDPTNIVLMERTIKAAKDLGFYLFEMFRYEERLIEDYQLPALAAHKAAHDEILGSFKRAVNDFQAGQVEDINFLKFGLLDVLIEHFNQIDSRTYKISSLKRHIRKLNGLSGLLDLLSLPGPPVLNDNIKKVSQVFVELKNMLDPANMGESLGVKLAQLADCMRSYAESEEMFMKENNNKKNFALQQEHHKNIIAAIEGIKNRSVDRQSTQRVVEQIIESWIIHVNQVDYDSHTFTGWVDIFFEVAESVGDVSTLLCRTGVDTIDGDHEAIIQTIIDCKLFEDNSIAGGKTLKEASEYLDDLISDSMQMFDNERKLMRQSKLPYFEVMNHELEHLSIMRYMRSLKRNVDEGGLYFSLGLKNKLLAQWISHFNYYDVGIFRQE